ncbi:hypothetical protein FQN53_008244, partial [Emmonsiellopsis sp. PD_33]
MDGAEMAPKIDEEDLRLVMKCLNLLGTEPLCLSMETERDKFARHITPLLEARPLSPYYAQEFKRFVRDLQKQLKE